MQRYIGTPPAAVHIAQHVCAYSVTDLVVVTVMIVLYKRKHTIVGLPVWACCRLLLRQRLRSFPGREHFPMDIQASNTAGSGPRRWCIFGCGLSFLWSAPFRWLYGSRSLKPFDAVPMRRQVCTRGNTVLAQRCLTIPGAQVQKCRVTQSQFKLTYNPRSFITFSFLCTFSNLSKKKEFDVRLGRESSLKRARCGTRRCDCHAICFTRSKFAYTADVRLLLSIFAFLHEGI